MKKIEKFPEFVRAFPAIDLPVPGARGWMLRGDGRQVVFAEFDETVEVPEHAHAEQWEFPLAGKVILRMKGESIEYLPGENFFIPAGVPHGATVHAGYRAMILFNEGDRYKPKS